MIWVTEMFKTSPAKKAKKISCSFLWAIKSFKTVLVFGRVWILPVIIQSGTVSRESAPLFTWLMLYLFSNVYWLQQNHISLLASQHWLKRSLNPSMAALTFWCQVIPERNFIRLFTSQPALTQTSSDTLKGLLFFYVFIHLIVFIYLFYAQVIAPSCFMWSDKTLQHCNPSKGCSYTR